MTTLAQFYTDVSAELRRGSAFDSSIPLKAQQAVRWLEDRHTWLHMETFNSGALDTLSAYPRRIAVPSGYKSMEFWRLLKDGDAGYRYLTKVDPKDNSRVLTEMPEGYWVSGKNYFWLDNTPDKDYSYEWKYNAYTTLPADTAQSPQIIQDYYGILLAQTCVLFAPRLRDEKFLALHKDQRDELMKAAVDADEEAWNTNQELSVNYGSEYVERVNEGA